jgi:hypothetical protein
MQLCACDITVDEAASRFIEDLDSTIVEEQVVSNKISAMDNPYHCENEENPITLVVSQNLLTKIQDVHMLEIGSLEA